MQKNLTVMTCTWIQMVRSPSAFICLYFAPDDFRMCSSTKQIGQGMDDKLQEVKKSLIFPSLAMDARGEMETVDTTTSITACLHDKSVNI